MADAEGEIVVYAFDLRSNCMVDTKEITEVGGQPAIGWTCAAATKQAGNRLEHRAFARMLDRVKALAIGNDPDAVPPVDAAKAWADQ
jgi:hypothetical protein